MIKKLFKKKKDYLFGEKKSTACLICNHILEDNYSILYVAHDEDDGMWQFLCGKENHSTDDARIISLEEAVTLDPSINGLHDMPLGIGAERSTKNTEWKAFKL